MIELNRNKMRKKSDYNDVENHYKNGQLANYKPIEGIKKPCIFNELDGFHSFENYSVDNMHNLLEGSGAFCIKLLIGWMHENEILHQEQIIGLIRDYDYGLLSKKNKPSLVKLQKSNLGQSAIQMQCLLTNLPFILYEYRERIGNYWKPVQSLLRVMQVSFSRKITTGDLIYLENSVKDHLNALQIDYKSKLIPKHHFLLHYKETFETSGPQVFTSMLPFERKHKILKDIAKKTYNFTNITKTLAERHQSMTFKEFAYADKIEISKRNKKVQNCKEFENIEKYLPIYLKTNETLQLSFLTFNGFHYVPNTMVIYRSETFEIKNILSLNNKFYFLCALYQNIDFNEFCNSMVVQLAGPALKIIEFENLDVKRNFEKVKVDGKVHIAAITLDLPCKQ